MSRRITGIGLIFVSAFLYATRYLVAAVMGSSMINWDAGSFSAMLQYVGRGLVQWSLVSLVGGLIYMVWAELGTLRKQDRKE